MIIAGVKQAGMPRRRCRVVGIEKGEITPQKVERIGLDFPRLSGATAGAAAALISASGCRDLTGAGERHHAITDLPVEAGRQQAIGIGVGRAVSADGS